MRTKLVPGLVALALLSACNSTTVPADDTTSSSSSVSMVTESSSSVAMMDASSSSDTGMMQSSQVTTGQTRVIEVASTNWTFSPSTITLTKGEKVVLRVKGGEGIHSFGVPGMNINVQVDPGETKDIEIPTGEAGSFEFRCLIPCGPGHKDMRGTIVIS